MTSPQYEVYAIKYAHHTRPASENFVGGDPLVLERYPAPSKALEGIVARLD